MDAKRQGRILNTASVSADRCVFCKIASGKAPSKMVYEDRRFMAFLDIAPFSEGHTLVCPKKHGETIWDMKDPDLVGLFKAASKVSKAVVAAVGADGFRFVQNNGEAANQVVAHVHVHVIPVKMEDKGSYLGRKSFTGEEMEDTARRVRAEMAKRGEHEGAFSA